MRHCTLAVVALVCLFASRAPADSRDLELTATWQLPTVEEIRRDVSAWLDKAGAAEQIKQQALELWADDNLDRSVVLSRSGETILLAEPRAADIVKFATDVQGSVPSSQWLDDEETPKFVSGNLKLLLGRTLCQRQYFDEALHVLDGIKLEEVVDPASLLFYRSVAYHRLLKQEEGLATIDRLLERKEEIPRRYAVLARLMRADLSQVKDESLDHISRRMEDIQRRLDFGRANQKVRDIEDGVIESLDKLIKKMEEQQQQSQSSSGGGNIQSSRPAEQSVPLGGKGPGEVTKKNIGNRSGWGELPPKEREEAMQEIGRDFPAHFRDVIEEYFREAAARDSGG